MRQQSFHPVCRKCNLRVYMNSLRGVGIRSNTTSGEASFEPWRKNFDLFLKTAFYVSKGTFSIKKFFLKVLFLFQTLRNFERNFTVLGEIVLGRDIKIEKGSFRLIRSIKKSNFWKFSLFHQIFQNFEQTFTVLGEKVLGRHIKIESCTLCLQSIMLGMKIIFWKFCKFSFYSDLEQNFLDLWLQRFHPDCQNCTLRVYLNSLWDVGIRSEIIYQDTFIEIWRENFDLFVETAVYVSKGTLWVKKTLFKSSVLFSNSSEIWTNIYCACRESFRQGYQNWKMQFSSHKIYQKIKLLKVLFFFQILQNLEGTFTVLGEKNLRQGYQNWKLQSLFHKIKQKIELLKNPFFQNLENFQRTFAVLGEKVLGRGIKIENCTLCLQSINLTIKILFRNFCKFSFVSDLEHEFFGFVATEFSPGLSKLYSTCLFEFFSRCWY